MNRYSIKDLAKVLFALVALFVFNIACEEEDIPINPQPDPAPKLTYTKQVITYDELTAIVGSSDKKAATAAIMKGVTGKKDGYSIRKIELVKTAPKGSASISTASGAFFIRLKGIASVTFTLTLKHATKARVTIKNCEIVVGKGKAVALTFNKLVKPYIKDGTFTTVEILAKVGGSKTDYKLKEIKNISPADVAAVDGKTIKMKKIGNFKADLVLEHPTKADATITGAQFKIGKATAESLLFNKLTKVYSSSGKFTTAEILGNVQGTKDGYKLKSISLLAPVGIATISGAAPNKQLNFTKAGSFTATLVLEHPNKADATIAGAQFQITKAPKETLTFNQLTKVYGSSGKFTTAEILSGVGGAKDGYTLKTISGLSPAGFATVSGTAPNLKLDFVKAGDFTATLVLEHATKADATITGAQFQITKTAKANLTFNQLTKVYSSSGKFTTAEILSGVGGTKDGYTLKTISGLSPTDFANVSGVAPNLQLNFIKAGSFTATLVLEHPTKADATITRASFEIKGAPTVLSFTPLSDVYKSNGKFTKTQIEAQVSPSSSGYSLKKIETLTPTGIVAIDGTNLNFKKAGDFTAKLTFGHATKADAVINAASFKITKIPVSLTFSKAHLSVKKGTFFTQPTLQKRGGSAEAVIYGIDKPSVATINTSTGQLNIVAVGTATITATLAANDTHKGANASYTLEVTDKTAVNLQFSTNTVNVRFGESPTKPTLSGHTASSGAISYESSDGAVATVDNNGNVTLAGIGSTIITVKQAAAGSYAAGKASYTLNVSKGEKATNLGFTTLSAVYSLGGKFAKAAIEAKVTPADSGYKLKEIKNISNDVASVSGKTITFNKAGSFTATLVLEHPTQEDATITGANFTITKASAASIGFSGLTKTYRSGGQFTKGDIEAKVTPAGSGYSLKSIGTPNPSGIATVSSDGKNLNFTKAGTFNVKLVLSHPNKKDATIDNATFTITKATASLSFARPTISVDFGASVSNTLTRNPAGGTLTYVSTVPRVASVDSRGNVTTLRIGSTTIAAFQTATDTHTSATTQYILFVNKATAEDLKFTKLSKVYSVGGAFSTNEILNNVTGSKGGYKLKSISLLAPAGVATVNGTAPNLKLSFTKGGDFTAKLVLVHPTKKDATITGARFKITKTNAVSLGFNKLVSVYSTGGQFSKTDIEAKVTPLSSGYSLKRIESISDTNIARISGTSIKFTKAGSFTARLVFAHPIKADVAIPAAQFQITKAAVNLKFSASRLRVVFKGVPFTEPTLSGQITGSGAGKITYGSGGAGIAQVDPSTGKLTIKGIGSTVIDAVQAATDTHEEGRTLYSLEVVDRKTVTLTFSENNLEAIFKGAAVTPPTLSGHTVSSGAITYKSDTKGVAIVDASTGALTIKGIGEANITATQADTKVYKSATASYKLTVKDKATLNLYFSQSHLSVKEGDSSFTEPTLKGKAGGGTVTYGSGDKNIATVDASTGKLSNLNIGTTKITATITESDTHKAATASYTLTVTNKTAVNLKFDEVIKTHIFNGVTTIAGAVLSGHTVSSGAVTYSSEKSSVATVTNDGKLTIKALGTTKITAIQASTATHDEGIAVYTLIVKDRTTPQLKFSASSLKATYGTSVTEPTLTGDYKGAGKGAITYTSSVPGVATIDANTGKLTLVKYGTSTITATQASSAVNKKATATYTLTVERGDPNLEFNPKVVRAILGGVAVAEPTLSGVSPAPWYKSSNTNVADVNPSTGKLTIKGAGRTRISVLQPTTDTHKADSAGYSLNVTPPISGTPTGLNGEWGKVLAPDYDVADKLPNPNGGGDGSKATYSYAIKSADATTGLKASDTDDVNKFDKTTGAIKAGASTGSGDVTITITRAPAINVPPEGYIYESVTKDVVLSFKRRAMPTGLTLTATKATWGAAITPTLTIPTVNGKAAYDRASEVTFTMRELSALATDGTKVGGLINSKTGKITGTQSGGKLEITATFAQNDRYKAGVKKVQVTVDGQEYAFTLNTASFSDKWDVATTKEMPIPGNKGVQLYTMFDGGYPDNVTYVVDGVGISDGEKASVLDYELNTKIDFDGSPLTGSSAGSDKDAYIRSKTYGYRNKGVRVRGIIASSADGKYKAKTIIGYLRTQQPLDALPITGVPKNLKAKWDYALQPDYDVPTTIPDPNDKDATLTPTYKYAIVAKKDGDAGIAIGESDNTKFDTTTGAFKAGATKGIGTVTVRITREAIAGKYKASQKDVDIVFVGLLQKDRSGLSGKWGKNTVTPDYDLNVTGGFNKATDFNFELMLPSVAAPNGLQKTTANIFTGGGVGVSVADIVKQKTGAVDTSKLLKSGHLLIKVTRKAKGAYKQWVEYVNFIVNKHDQSDYPTFAITASDVVWDSDIAVAPTYTISNAPAGIGSPEYLKTNLASSAVVNSLALTIDDVTGRIRGTARSGVVKVRVKYATNDKYEEMIHDLDVNILKKDIAGMTQITATSPYLVWADGGGEITLNYGDMPAGIANPSYAVKSFTTDGTVTITNTKNISGATSSGDVVVTVTANAADVKYKGKQEVTIPVARQVGNNRPLVKNVKDDNKSWDSSKTKVLSEDYLLNAFKDYHKYDWSDVTITLWDGSPGGIAPGKYAQYGTDYVVRDRANWAGYTKDGAQNKFKAFKGGVGKYPTLRILKRRKTSKPEKVKVTFYFPENKKYGVAFVDVYWRTPT